MSMSGIPAAGGRGGRRRRGGKKALMSEINVTPMVDVMLVLLIIFMVSAPLLVTGIPLDLPKTEAGALGAKKTPVTISIDAVGAYGVNETKLKTPEEVIAALEELKAKDPKMLEEAIVFKADKSVNYEQMMTMLAKMQKAGFTKINLGSAAKGK